MLHSLWSICSPGTLASNVKKARRLTWTITKCQWTAHRVLKMSFSLCLFSLFSFYFSLQAVETNLASKDSHWVYANEVRPNANTLICSRVNLDLNVSLPLLTQSLVFCQSTHKPTKSTVSPCEFTFPQIGSTSSVCTFLHLLMFYSSCLRDETFLW